MRIVAISDTHCLHHKLPPIPDGDVLVHAGDFCRMGELKEFLPAAVWLNRLPHRRKIVIAGNHDWCFAEQLAQVRALLAPEVEYLQDSSVVVDGVTFHGSPWQPAFYGWAFNLERGAPLAAKWALIPGDVDVLVTHGPPFGFGDRNTAGQRQGCEDLLEAVKRTRPLLHLFGHIHEDGGCWHADGTTFANVAAGGYARAASVFDLDVATRTVTPVEIPPNRVLEDV